MNMLATMKPTAAALAPPASRGANVGPSVSVRSPPMPAEPIEPCHTSGSTMKNSPAKAPLANIARGMLRTGSFISPT